MTTEERVARLERFNRLLLLGLLVLAVAFTVAATKESIPDVVKARAFHVVARDGTPLVKLEDTVGLAAGRFGSIATFDSNGSPLLFGLAEDATDGGFVGTFTTFNGKGPLVRLSATVGGRGQVTTLNGKGQPLVELSSTADGRGAVQTLNGKGQLLVRLGAAAGRGQVTTLNGKGQPLVALTARKDGPGAVLTYDPRSIEARGEFTTH